MIIPKIEICISRNKNLFNAEQAFRSAEINQWTKKIEYSVDAGYKCVEAKISIKCDEAWYIDSKRELLSIEGEITPPFPVGCWLVCSLDGKYWQVDLPKFPHMHFVKTRDGVDAFFTVRDLDSLGILYWGSEKIAEPMNDLKLSLWVYHLDSPDECAWVEPYPNGAKAAICLTDHADWDSVEKMRLLNDLFEKYDFRFTKSIFPHSDPEGSKNEPGLDNPEFKKEIDRLNAMGSEIAYHGLSPRINPPDYDICLERIESMSEYQTETWIDHGTGQYLYSRKASFDNGVKLTDILGKNGVHNYWSYADIWENPCHDLNVWSSRTIADSLKDILCLMKRKKHMSGKQFAYIAATILKNTFGGAEYRQLKKSWKPSIAKRLYSQYQSLKKLHVKPTVIYNEAGIFALNNMEGNWIFDSILLNHLSLQLAPESIDRLIQDNGLLIAHCYMGAQHKYGGSNCFVGDSEEVKLLNSFEESMAYISMKQKTYEIITMSFKEFRESCKKFMNTILIKKENSWSKEMRNKNETEY